MSENKTEGAVNRREFAAKAGKLALLAPAMTFLLSTSMTSTAIASSGGRPQAPSAPPRPRAHRPDRKHNRRQRRRR